MKNRKLLIFVLYILPYSYMAMAIDILKGSVLSYILMMLLMGALMLLSCRTGNVKVAVLGNALSLAFSYILAINFPLSESWTWFFKPFTPSQMTVFLYIVSFIIQTVIYFIKKKKAAY